MAPSPVPPARAAAPRARRRLALALALAALAPLGAAALALGRPDGAALAADLRARHDTGAAPRPAAPPPPLEPAVIALPIAIQTSAILAQLERAVPRADSLDQARCEALRGVVCHQYVYRRDTTLLTVAGDRVTLVARLRYRGRVALPNGGSVGSCGYAPEPMRRAELRMATSLYWRSDWRLASRNTQLGSTLADPCEVTLLRVDASPAMRRLADWQLGRMAQQVDSALPATADLRRAADSLWRAMQQPLPVDSAGTTWLVMAPETIALAPLDGQGATVRTGVTLTARPRIVTGPRPEVPVRPLPVLTLARPASGLRVPVEVELPFAEIGRLAAETLREQTRREPLRVTDVKVTGSGDSAFVRLSMEGRLSGELKLVGRPRWDAEARALVMDDLDYTLESRGIMSRIKATLAAPFIRKAIMEATGGGRMAVGPKLDSTRTQLSAQLNRPLAPGVVVGGGVSDLRVTGLHTTPTAFVVRVLLTGQAGLWAR